jgi:DNA-binding NarL/FixJ family response regulator
MSESLQDAVVVSQHRLLRDMLSEFLRIRCGVRVLGRFASIEEAASLLADGRLLLCEMSGLDDRALDNFLARAAGKHPNLRVLRVDLDLYGCDELTEAVRCALRPTPGSAVRLTPHEEEVLLAVAAGMRNSEIARRLHRSSKTVEKHRASAQRKLGLRNVAQLTAYTIRHGLLTPDSILGRRRS